MGYTHYWSGPDSLDAAARKEIIRFARDVIAEAEGTFTTSAGGYYAKDAVAICGGLGEGDPGVTNTVISINGDSARGLDHETFYIDLVNPREGGFCKTARKPYDVVVTAILAYLSAYHGFNVSSDGDAPDWEAGVELANRVAGKPVPNPIIVQVLA